MFVYIFYQDMCGSRDHPSTLTDDMNARYGKRGRGSCAQLRKQPLHKKKVLCKKAAGNHCKKTCAEANA